MPQLDALPWAVGWMCAGVAEAGGMVVALAGAESAEPLFGALEVRALAAARCRRAAAGLGTREVPGGGGVRRRRARVSEFRVTGLDIAPSVNREPSYTARSSLRQ